MATKQLFKLTHDELMAILAAFEQGSDGEVLWRAICGRVGAVYETITDAKTGDPHEFFAEPVSKAVALVENESDRGTWTSASNAQADSLCPGRHLAQRGIPEQPKGEDAATGTRIHAALANEAATATLSVEERDTFDACREIERKLILGYLGDNAKYRSDRHKRYWAKWPNHAHSGEADVVFRFGTKALILDYKVLSGDVAESARNEQLRDLAVLVKANTMMLEEIAVAIVQPLVTHSPELCVYTNADFERALPDMMKRVEASNNPASGRVAGEVQCKWCKAKTACKEFNQWQGKLVPVLTDDSAALFSVAMANWKPEQRALAASILPIATKRLDEIKEFLKGLLEADPSAIPGYKLKPGSMRETITNSQECFDRFAAEGGHLAEFLTCIKVEKGKFKEAVAEVVKLKGMKLKAKLETMLEGITESKQSAPSLARLEDK